MLRVWKTKTPQSAMTRLLLNQGSLGCILALLLLVGCNETPVSSSNEIDVDWILLELTEDVDLGFNSNSSGYYLVSLDNTISSTLNLTLNKLEAYSSLVSINRLVKRIFFILIFFVI